MRPYAVEGEAWGLELSEYVHLNPVRISALGQGKRQRAADRAGGSRPPTAEEVKRRLEKLRRYRHSGVTLAELGRRAGGRDYAAVTMAVHQFNNSYLVPFGIAADCSPGSGGRRG
jgi:hypothetical protein